MKGKRVNNEKDNIPILERSTFIFIGPSSSSPTPWKPRMSHTPQTSASIQRPPTPAPFRPPPPSKPMKQKKKVTFADESRGAEAKADTHEQEELLRLRAKATATPKAHRKAIPPPPPCFDDVHLLPKVAITLAPPTTIEEAKEVLILLEDIDKVVRKNKHSYDHQLRSRIQASAVTRSEAVRRKSIRRNANEAAKVLDGGPAAQAALARTKFCSTCGVRRSQEEMAAASLGAKCATCATTLEAFNCLYCSGSHDVRVCAVLNKRCVRCGVMGVARGDGHLCDGWTTVGFLQHALFFEGMASIDAIPAGTRFATAKQGLFNLVPDRYGRCGKEKSVIKRYIDSCATANAMFTGIEA